MRVKHLSAFGHMGFAMPSCIIKSGHTARLGTGRPHPSGISGFMVYDRNQAADLAGLSPVTLTNYTRPGYSDLVRDSDYFVRSWQDGPYHRRKLFFTKRGLYRLLLRAYRVFRPGSLSYSQLASIARMDATVRLARRDDRPGQVSARQVPAGGQPPRAGRGRAGDTGVPEARRVCAPELRMPKS